MLNEGRFCFPREYRLSDGVAIKRAFKGVSFTEKTVKLFIVENGLNYNRYLITFKRNFKTATKRNHFRRMSKEVLRHINHLLEQGYDVVFLFTEPNCDFKLKLNPLSFLLRKAGLFLA